MLPCNYLVSRPKTWHGVVGQDYASGKKPIARPNPSKIIQSDASKLGWGAVCDSQKTGGRWAPDESGAHINYLELLAAFLALKTFCSADVNIHGQLQLDNTTAIAYLNNMVAQNLLNSTACPFKYGNGASKNPCGCLQFTLRGN